MDFTHKGSMTINGYADSGLSVSIRGNDVDVDSRLFKMLVEENAKLKADKVELIAFLESVANCHAIIGIGDEDVSDKGRARKLPNKHKEQSNGN